MYDFYLFFVPVFQVRGQLAGNVEVNHLHPHALLIQQPCLIFIITSCEVITAVIIQTPGTASWPLLILLFLSGIDYSLASRANHCWLTPGWAYYPFISELNFIFIGVSFLFHIRPKFHGLEKLALLKSLPRICPLRSPFRGSPLGLVRSLIFLC